MSATSVRYARRPSRGQGRCPRAVAFALVCPLVEVSMSSARVVRRLLVLSTVVAAVLVAPSSRGPGAQPAALAPHQQLLREIYQELIEINTTNSIGDNTKAAEAMAHRLIAAGFPAADVQVLVPAPRKGNVVARLRG